VNMVMNLLVP